MLSSTPQFYSAESSTRPLHAHQCPWILVLPCWFSMDYSEGVCASVHLGALGWIHLQLHPQRLMQMWKY